MAVSSTVTNLFGKSPFKALQLHMQSVTEVTDQLPGLIDAVKQGDQAGIKTLRDTISKLEGKADELKNSMRSHFPKSFFTPVARRDLLEILDLQDNMADNTEIVANLLTLRSMEVPKDMEGILTEVSALCAEACKKASETIGELHLLVEAGFSGREADRIARMIVELSALRNETDQKVNEFSLRLFNQEDQIKPVAVIMWFKIIEHMSKISHNAEQVGDRLRLLLAH